MSTSIPAWNPEAEVARLRRQSAQRKYIKRMRLVRLLWALAMVTLVGLCIEVLVAVGFSPRFWIYRLDVKPMETLTRVEVVKRMALPEGSNFYRVSLREMEKRIGVDPRVAHAQVTRGTIGVLRVAVRERQPVCQIGYTDPPVYMDARGYVFMRPHPPNEQVVIIEGVKLPTYRSIAGKRLQNARVKSVQATLAHLSRGQGEGTLDIARILVGQDGWITLVLKQGTQVFVGHYQDLDIQQKSWYIEKAIVAASEKGYALVDLDFIDVRYVVPETGMGIRFHPKSWNGEHTSS